MIRPKNASTRLQRLGAIKLGSADRGSIASIYIIAEGLEGLFLIDQHTAHERVSYEQLSANRAGAHDAIQEPFDPAWIPSLARAILDEMEQREEPLENSADARLITSICKSIAVKGGQVLSLDEMRELVRQLEQTASPRTCPHGRPTAIQLNLGQLERVWEEMKSKTCQVSDA